MKKCKIEKIEEKLSDVDVKDSVLDIALAEMSKSDKAHKPVMRKFNFKIALTCAASFALCLSIILPIALSSLGGNDMQEPDLSAGDDAPSGVSGYYELQWLKKEQVYPDTGYDDPSDNDSEVQPPAGGSAINYLSHIKYSDGGTAIISEEKYSVCDSMCTVYTLYNIDIKIDVLEQFENFTSEYFTGSAKVKYKSDAEGYLADAIYNNKRYCFTLDLAEQSVFEEFCLYLFK